MAQAGHLGMVTIATNMAGRGTDIVLGEAIRRFLAEAASWWKKNRARALLSGRRKAEDFSHSGAGDDAFLLSGPGI